MGLKRWSDRPDLWVSCRNLATIIKRMPRNLAIRETGENGRWPMDARTTTDKRGHIWDGVLSGCGPKGQRFKSSRAYQNCGRIWAAVPTLLRLILCFTFIRCRSCSKAGLWRADLCYFFLEYPTSSGWSRSDACATN